MRIQPVVADSSALIALAQIDQLDLLRALFQVVLIPPAVVLETAPSVARYDWLAEHSLSRPIAERVRVARLGPGESEAISLALELGADRLIVDDRDARRLASSLGIPVLGTLGVLQAARRIGLLSAIRPHLDALIQARFFINRSLYERILRDAGEDAD